ncbi:SDR family NAD(P)-dependent oxidoreductase [Paenibacillus baimaensis]|uniref:SDR family NAD(P)-dependent oxidoreductase n=1 Tax=Paenibacillus baimaensis TaxID=2982185 RepID=UPI0038CD67C5
MFLELAHLFLQDILERHQGAIINVAAAAGFQSMPFMAVYGATKAFIISWSEALWSETREKGKMTVIDGRDNYWKAQIIRVISNTKRSCPAQPFHGFGDSSFLCSPTDIRQEEPEPKRHQKIHPPRWS